MSHDPHNDDVLLSWTSIPECQWIPQCDLLLIPGGCKDCDYTRDDLLRDEDGEPIDIPGEPTASAF